MGGGGRGIGHKEVKRLIQGSTTCIRRNKTTKQLLIVKPYIPCFALPPLKRKNYSVWEWVDLKRAWSGASGLERTCLSLSIHVPLWESLGTEHFHSLPHVYHTSVILKEQITDKQPWRWGAALQSTTGWTSAWHSAGRNLLLPAPLTYAQGWEGRPGVSQTVWAGG